MLENVLNSKMKVFYPALDALCEWDVDRMNSL
jgi:hypothetical protein